MKFTRPQEEVGLPGLLPICKSLDVKASALAIAAEVHPNWAGRILNGTAGCSLATLKAFARHLCCTANDLLSAPTPQRLAQIKAAYHEHQANLARAEAGSAQSEERAAS